VREMVKELKEFGIDVFCYNPLLSKEEIEELGVKALDFSFSTNFSLKKKPLLKKNPFLAQVLSSERKCVDVRGIFDEEEAKKRGFYYRSL
jgi:hypothetical protein